MDNIFFCKKCNKHHCIHDHRLPVKCPDCKTPNLPLIHFYGTCPLCKGLFLPEQYLRYCGFFDVDKVSYKKPEVKKIHLKPIETRSTLDDINGAIVGVIVILLLTGLIMFISSFFLFIKG